MTRIVLLVSANGEQGRAWKRVLAMLGQHKEFGEFATLTHVDLPAEARGRFRRGLLRKWFPTFRDKSDALKEVVQEALGKGGLRDRPAIALVGYRSGCPVIQSLLLDLLVDDKDLATIASIRRVILFAPRHRQYAWLVVVGIILCSLLSFATKPLLAALGIQVSAAAEGALALVGGVGIIVGTLFQALSSRDAAALLGYDFDKLHRGQLEDRFETAFVNGAKNQRGTWPVPVQTITGLNLSALDANTLRAVASKLMSPAGHKNVHELELEEDIDTIIPVAGSEVPADIRLTPAPDHKVRVERIVRFSAANATESEGTAPKWVLGLRTTGKIAVLAVPKEKNYSESAEEREFLNNRSAFVFRFVPEAGREYRIAMDSYGAHGPGNRDSHCHFRADVNYQLVRKTLDLRPLLAKGWQITAPPVAYFLPGRLPSADGARLLDNGDCSPNEMQRVRAEGIRIENESGEKGLYVWRVEDVREGGLFAYEYDVAEPGAAGRG